VTPEEAVERARARAKEQPPSEPGQLEGTIGEPDLDDLERWARIHVDPDGVYSTRRLGAPITGFKRLLLRLLRQQQVEMEAQQTRFNVAVVEHLRRLERGEK
jgi:hypothetical protein